MMISKAKIKYIRSLEIKKNRTAEGVFVAEGPKVVGDLLKVMPPRMLIATDTWMPETPVKPETEIIRVTDEELKKVSFLKAPQQVIGVFRQLEQADVVGEGLLEGRLSLMLDGVQDPGNLGTIIRIADWFGIENVVCSTDTAEVYNPKVVQATMGSIARVKVTYTDLERVLSTLPADFPVYGTLLDGENIYQERLTKHGIIVMGNEGSGISAKIKKRIGCRLLIPNYPMERETADSLNVAVATAIVCAEFRRRG